MSAQSFARDFENLGNTAVVPNTTNVVELNCPITIDRAVLMGTTLGVTGATTLTGAVTMASTLAVTGAITATGGITNGSVSNALTALASGGQSGATQLVTGKNRVTVCATIHDSVALPAATAGAVVQLVNVGAAGCDVYPLGATDVIQGIAVQTPMQLGSGFSIEFLCVVAGTWSVFDNALPGAFKSTGALQGATFAAGSLTGGANVVYTNTGTTPASLTTRTATQMFNDMPNAQVGQSYLLTVINLSGSANTATLVGGTGVTITGTATIAQNIARVYTVTFNTATTMTLLESHSYTAAA